VERKGESASAIASYDPSNPKLRRAGQGSDCFGQEGKNTNYVIDLEEILADNFEFRLIGKTDLPPPELLVILAAALKQAAKAQ
jgi:hypothetical protein